MCVLVAQSCLTLRNPVDSSLPVSSVHGILQARVLEWVASFLNPCLIYLRIHYKSHSLYLSNKNNKKGSVFLLSCLLL